MIPFKLKQMSIECFIARLLASVAAGIVVGVVAPHVAAHFQQTLNPFIPTVAGLVTGLLTWFATRRVFAFAGDCLEVPSVSTAVQSDAARRVRTVPALKPAPAAVAAKNETAVLETFPQEDGSLLVVVTVKGLTKREFKALRGRLEQLRGVSWSQPINLRDGRRKMEGVLPAGPARPEALKKLEELTGNRV